MAKSRSIVLKMDGTNIVTDDNGVAVSVIQVSSTVDKGKSNERKIKTPVECPHFRQGDVTEVEDEGEIVGVTVTLPTSWGVDRFLKALNQGTRLLAQQPVHQLYTESGAITKHRAEAIGYCHTHHDDADVQVLSSKIASGKLSMKEINSLYDDFYDEFIAED